MIGNIFHIILYVLYNIVHFIALCVIIKGNKVDLLPPDARHGFLRHFRQILHCTLKESGFVDHFNILHTSLISAKTGYGIEDLITVRI